MPNKQTTLVSKDEAIKGRPTPIIQAKTMIHPVLGESIALEPDPEKSREIALFAMGCFWGAERLFWQQPGVLTTAVVYCGGYTENPTYREVCTGKTAHAEGVRIIFDANILSYDTLLKLFWENHDPTQGMAQKNDVGTQYRSVIYYANDAQKNAAQLSKMAYQQQLSDAGFELITTSIEPISSLYYAEEEHQQYLHKNPNGYCSIGGLGICSKMV